MPTRVPPATLGIILATIGVFILQQVAGPSFIIWFALWPWGPVHTFTQGPQIFHASFQVWQLITYGFLHGGIAHIFFNMFALFIFGGAIEMAFGRNRYLFYYFACIVTAALAHLLVVHFFTGGFYPTIGASGGVFGILLAFGMLFPHQRIALWFVLPMPAWVFVAGYGVLELVFGITGTASGIAHFAHLGGMLGGIILILYWRGKLPLKPKKRLLY